SVQQLQQLLRRFRRGHHPAPLILCQRQFERPLDAAFAKLAHRSAKDVADPVLAPVVYRTRDQPPLVEQDRLHHCDGRRRWREVR
ncbi:MAG: argininosuccinate lyase, partial [Dehalococcoidia bacterium]